MPVVYFDQHLGVAHSKPYRKSPFSIFLQDFDAKMIKCCELTLTHDIIVGIFVHILVYLALANASPSNCLPSHHLRYTANEPVILTKRSSKKAYLHRGRVSLLRCTFVQPNIGSWLRPVLVLTCPNKPIFKQFFPLSDLVPQQPLTYSLSQYSLFNL